MESQSVLVTFARDKRGSKTMIIRIESHLGVQFLYFVDSVSLLSFQCMGLSNIQLSNCLGFTHQEKVLSSILSIRDEDYAKVPRSQLPLWS